MFTSDGGSLIDDMSSEMCRISYRIRVSVSKRSPSDDKGEETLRVVAKKVRIVPVVEEEPPLVVADDGEEYRLRDEKQLKTGFTRKTRGSLVAVASQPEPLQLHPAYSGPTSDVSTNATVHLQFNPAGDEQPPQLGSLCSKLRVSTFYTITPWADFPTSSYADSLGRHHYTTTVPLSSLCMGSPRWIKHFGAKASQASTSATAGNDTYYTTTLIAPITLPATKTFVPTFHSCLISRVYAVDVSISYHTLKASLLAPTLSLRLPIQVTSLPRWRPCIDPPLYQELDHDRRAE
ncbi:hypothetical protein BBP40_007839 [Aspergillus hancockii]|nr:hypothetical protein BBP40_007839 [Aspergillus hancockii]